MATKAKTKANRTAEHKSSRSQTASRSKERQQAARNAFDVLEKDHREVEEWFDQYDELKDDIPGIEVIIIAEQQRGAEDSGANQYRNEEKNR